jgi:hypothetical protein
MHMGTDDRVESASRGRRESYEEKLDRNWNDLLQELRVMQTGAQIITAFLMTLPFQSRFEDLDAFQRTYYVVLLAFSALLTGLITTPVAIHRRMFGKHVKATTVAHGHRIVRISVVCVGIMVSACVGFIVDVMSTPLVAVLVGGGVTVVIVFLLVVFPSLLRPERAEPTGADPGSGDD